MISVLDFVTDSIRLQNKNISQFLNEVKGHFSRSSFYRLMNEPEKISDDEIIILKKALKFDEEKEQEFRSIIRQAVAGYDDTERSEILKLLYTEPVCRRRKAPEVEFFSTNLEHNKTFKSYEEVLKGIKEHLNLDSKIKIKIRNSVSDSSLTSLYAFISLLREMIVKIEAEENFILSKEKKALKHIKVEVEHILTVGEISNLGKIKLLFSAAQIIQFCKYSLSFLEYVEKKVDKGNSDLGVCDFVENTVSLRIENKEENDNRYLIFHLTNIEGRRDYCFEAEGEQNKCFYSFFRAMFNRLKNETANNKNFATVGAAQVNEEISKYDKGFRKILIKDSPCLDNFYPAIWSELIKQAFTAEQNNKHPETLSLEEFRRELDEENSSPYLSTKDFFTAQAHLLKMRFDSNEHPGSINIFDMFGFQDFMKTGTTREISKKIIPLSKTLRKVQLMYTVWRIWKHYSDCNYQQFYFFKKKNSMSDIFISVVDTEGVCFLNENCINLINSNFLYRDLDMAKLLYNVIANSMPSDEVLTKEQSIAFLRGQYNELISSEVDISFDDYLKYIDENNDETIAQYLNEVTIK